MSLCFLLLVINVPIKALDRSRTIGQFHHTAWTAKDGAPGSVRALAQTSDGFLWLGTSGGLFRFDGLLFERYQPRSGGDFPSDNVYSLMSLPDGGLWISYWFGGASFLKDGNLTNFGEADGLPTGRIQSFAAQGESIWAAVAGGLARFRNGKWERVGKEMNYPGSSAQAVFVDRDETVWVATENTITFLKERSASFERTPEMIQQVLQFAQSKDGTLWIAETSRSVRQIRISTVGPASLGPEIRVGSVSILFDRSDAMWITTLGDGLRRVPNVDLFRGKTIARFGRESETMTEKDGLSADYASAVLEDREGNIWIGSAAGLDRFRDCDIIPVRFPPGVQDVGLAAGEGSEIWVGSSNQGAGVMRGGIVTPAEPSYGVVFLYRDVDNSIWMASTIGIFRRSAGSYLRIAIPAKLKISGVSSMFRDRNGALWVYLDREGAFLLKDGKWTKYSRQSELPEASPIIGAIDSSDRKWFGYANSKLVIIDGEEIRTYSGHDGLAVGDVKSIREGSGRLWIGGSKGLAVYKDGNFRMIAADDPAGFNGVSGIVETADGSLWLSQAAGIVNIPAGEIEMALDDPEHRVHYRVFDFLDGLPGTVQQVRPFPTAVQGSDGKIWFATSGGLAGVDPNRIFKNDTAPPVSVRSLTTDAQTYLTDQPLELPRGTTNFRINYTALSLSIPERARFRYRIEGVDDMWHDAGSRREAFYTNLGPGTYKFRVIAANNDGVWNEDGAAITFSILPMFYQTNWFRLLALATIVLLTWMIYRWRVHHLHSRMQLQFEQRLSERTRLAQNLHDTLLQGVASAAMQLQVTAKHVPDTMPAKARLDGVNDIMKQLIVEGRNAVSGLRSNKIVFASDLEEQLTRVRSELDPDRRIEFQIVVEGTPTPLLPAVGDECHQICREALINSFRHSGAGHIEVEIEYAKRFFRIFVRDDGRGIEQETLLSGRAGHWGMIGMRERAELIGADLKFRSSKSAGTEVELSVPNHIAFQGRSEGLFSRARKIISVRRHRAKK